MSPQAHQQVLAPVLSSRRGLAGRNPDPAPRLVPDEAAAAQPQRCRRARTRIPSTNQEALEKLQRCSDERERRALREQLVRKNLPLVYAITARMGRKLALPQEDLRQIGSLGLLRAIDAFQPSRGRTLSSFAVPYIRGAIQHELRDRASLMRIPRPLWELRRRATVLQDRRRRLGQPQLAPAQLAEALECSTAQVIEALQVAAVVEMRSLDAPSSGEWGEDGGGRTLLETLPDPASLVDAAPDGAASQPEAELDALIRTGSRDAAQAPAPEGGQPARHGRGQGAIGSEASAPTAPLLMVPAGWPSSPELSWLQRRLGALTAQERQLLLGHTCQGRSWAELGRELGLHPRQAQRRTVALLSRLEAEGRRWREGDAAADAPF